MENEITPQGSKSIKTWQIILFPSIFCTLLIVSGYRYFKQEEKAIRTEKYNDLHAIAVLKINQLQLFINERISDTKEIVYNSLVQQAIEQLHADKRNITQKYYLISQLQLTKKYSPYEDILISSTNGEMLVSTNNKEEVFSQKTISLIKQAIAKNKITLDLHYCEKHKRIHYNIIAPISNDKKIIIAALVMRINPKNNLYPLLQSWPTPSKTAETLLVQKENDSVLFLNELRHKKNTALKFRIALTHTKIPAVHAALGYKGLFRGIDYRGKNVLADINPIHDTKWIMISKIDTKEIYSEIEYRAITIILFTSIFIILFSLIFALIYYLRQKNIYKKLFLIEKELHTNKELFRKIFYEGPIAMAIVSPTFQFEIINQAFEKLLGYTQSEIQHLTFPDITHSDYIKNDIENIKKLQKGEIPVYKTEKQYISKNQKIIWGDLQVNLIYDQKGNFVSHLAIINDITELKNSEISLKEKSDELETQNEEYLQLNEELMQTNEELIKAKEKALESDRLKSAFLANMSHEIRTPMNGILGFSQLLLKPNITEEKKKHFVEIINTNGNQLLEIINDIIDISKIELGLISINSNTINLNSLLNDIETIIKPNTLNKKVELVLAKSKTPIQNNITTDDIKLRQILTNLLMNAIKFTDIGMVTFGYTIKNPYIEFYITDTGIGIPTEKFETVFNRFQQLDNQPAESRIGTGLGLAISKAYVELLGGTIWLTSELNKGTTFYFTIPYMSTQNTNENNNEDPVTIYDWANKTILIVDDDESNYMYLVELLSKTNAKIIYAENGQIAVDIFKQNQSIDLLLMDTQMPILNGYEATQEIRLINKEVPIIAQTAYAFSEDILMAIKCGCNDYIIKPILQDKLLVIIHKWIS